MLFSWVPIGFRWFPTPFLWVYVCPTQWHVVLCAHLFGNLLTEVKYLQDAGILPCTVAISEESVETTQCKMKKSNPQKDSTGWRVTPGILALFGPNSLWQFRGCGGLPVMPCEPG